MRTDLPLAACDSTEHFTPDHHLVLWESIPPGLRTAYFTIPRVPEEYLGAFRANGYRRPWGDRLSDAARADRA